MYRNSHNKESHLFILSLLKIEWSEFVGIRVKVDLCTGRTEFLEHKTIIIV